MQGCLEKPKNTEREKPSFSHLEKPRVFLKIVIKKPNFAEDGSKSFCLLEEYLLKNKTRGLKLALLYFSKSEHLNRGFQNKCISTTITKNVF